ncbi:MAG: glutaminyl-peptide cyclotransferase [Anaerolineaceae bacterium]|nr:glutaminyl-peptide cyclotransferase [Anaerolineaceae bacterium]
MEEKETSNKTNKTNLIVTGLVFALAMGWLMFNQLKPKQTPQAGTSKLNLSELKLGDFGDVEVIKRYPHDTNCYTQGLIYRDGFLFESCGLYGQSNLRKLELESGKVLQESALDPQYFAEGLIELDDLLYLLTWKEGTAFIYNSETFENIGQFSYSTEGWGLTTDGSALIMSDGSNKLSWLDPQSGFVAKEVHVTRDGQPIQNLNELEMVDGKIFANIYLSDQIAIIDPETGIVDTILNLAKLKPAVNMENLGEVLNGIAYDEESGRLFVTGKKWPWLYEIQLLPGQQAPLPSATPLPSPTPPLPLVPVPPVGLP